MYVCVPFHSVPAPMGRRCATSRSLSRCCSACNLDVDVIANIANGDVDLDGYVHAIAILDVVDLDVYRFATFNVVDVLLAVYLLVVAVYFATLLDVVDLVVVVVDVLYPFSPFDVLSPFLPLDVWNLLHPFDVVDVCFGANLLGLVHLDDLVVLDVEFPYKFA